MHEFLEKSLFQEVTEHSSFDLKISKWKASLGIPHYTIKTYHVPTAMVTEVNFETGGEIVGITPNHTELFVSLFHTRPLEDDDIVHELLHVKYPDLGEDEINIKMDEILGSKINKQFKSTKKST